MAKSKQDKLEELKEEAPKAEKEEKAEAKAKGAKPIYEIHTKNKEYNGVVAGITFQNGIGKTENKYIADFFVSKGWGEIA